MTAIPGPSPDALSPDVLRPDASQPRVPWIERGLERPGWRQRLSLLFLGALGGLALPPLHLVVLLIPAFAGLLIALSACSTRRRAFAAGWWFGLGHFAVGFYWLGHAFLIDAQRYGFLAPPAVIGMAAGLAVFPGLASALTAGIGARVGSTLAGRALILAVAWVFFEWLRGWILTGFPWNLIGSVWTFSDAMVQTAAYVGVYGLSLLTVAVAALFAVFQTLPAGAAGARSALGLGLLAVLWAGGTWRLSAPDPGDVDGIQLRLVQPNVPQHLKWAPGHKVGHVRKMLDMSLAKPANDGPMPTHVIWPETAIPFNFASDAALRAAVARVVPTGGLVISGAPKGEKRADGSTRLSNSLHAINAAGDIVATYDKRHLVPFGEYVPMRQIFKFSKLTAGRLDFTPGTGPRILDLPGLPPALALICYEVIFPAEVADTPRRPAWMVNITNDAWFGQSAGPYQHLAAARLRAVEQGVPLIRVANTGVSAVIDAFGRRRAELALGQEGIVDTGLPAALASPPPYARFGDWIMLVLAAVCLGGGMVCRHRPAAVAD